MKLKTKINNKLIRSFNPCYDPKEIGIQESEILSVKEWIVKYADKVNSQEDVLWLICRNEFMTEKDMRLFAVWCAREALKLDDNPDERSVNACNVSEKFANGEATNEELAAARAAAWAATRAAARAAAWDAAWDTATAAAWDAALAAATAAAWDAALAAARAAAWDTDRAARDAQIKQLLSYFD